MSREKPSVSEPTQEENKKAAELRSIFNFLPDAYQIYCDKMEDVTMTKEEKLAFEEKKRKLAEFLKGLNPKYRDFLSNLLEKQIQGALTAVEKGKEAGVLTRFVKEYEKKL